MALRSLEPTKAVEIQRHLLDCRVGRSSDIWSYLLDTYVHGIPTVPHQEFQTSALTCLASDAFECSKWQCFCSPRWSTEKEPKTAVHHHCTGKHHKYDRSHPIPASWRTLTHRDGARLKTSCSSLQSRSIDAHSLVKKSGRLIPPLDKKSVTVSRLVPLRPDQSLETALMYT